MSDCFLRLIPAKPTTIPPEETHRRAVALLHTLVQASDRIEVYVFPRVVFVDPGVYLASVICPYCRADLMEAWQLWMEQKEVGHFSDLTVMTTCCGTRLSLNDLLYQSPAGFARFMLEVMIPGMSGMLSVADVAALEVMLGCELRQIIARY